MLTNKEIIEAASKLKPDEEIEFKTGARTDKSFLVNLAVALNQLDLERSFLIYDTVDTLQIMCRTRSNE